MVICVFLIVFASFCCFSLAFPCLSSLDCICLLISPVVSFASPCIMPLLTFAFLAFSGVPLLFLVVSCFPLLSLTCSCLPATEASGASPAGLAILIFLCLALGFPCFCLRSLVIPCFLLLCFHVLLASLLIGFPGVPSLSLAFPCFPFPALAFSAFTLC